MAGLGATPLPAHSLDWGVVLRPASFLAFVALLRLPPLRHWARAAALVGAPSARLARIPSRAAPPPDGVFGADAAPEEFAALLPEGLAHLPLRPDFDRPALLWLVTQAARKERRGALVCRIVRDRRGCVAGGYVGHLRQRGLTRVVQMFTVPARAEAVVDEMLAHAREFGAVAVMGRSRPEAPALMGALELRRALFLCASGFSLVHSRAPELAEAVARGEGCVTGLAGEAWVRVIDGEFA